MTIGQPEQTREAIAHREVGHTDVGRGTVRFLLAAFLLFIVAVPIFEFVAAARDPQAVNAWEQLGGIPAGIRDRQSAAAAESSWQRLIAANRAVLEGLHGFEEALEDESNVGRRLRPPAQAVMTRWLGAGNELAYVGRDGWLFYRPDVEYATGSGFLDRRQGARRIAAADEWQTPPRPDPRPAILDFKNRLEAQGITLILMPTPVKAAIHPEQLARRAATTDIPVHNPSYDPLIEELRAAGVLVFDPAPVLVDTLRATSAPQYLATDTHWRPEAVELVAERLAEFIRLHVQLPSAEAYYNTAGTEVQNLGDIAVMLDLPKDQTLFKPEAVAIRRVVDADGGAWRPDRNADVLVLGDSFSNIYSLASLGWGESAGLIEHLSNVLQRPLDRIVQNDQGSHATRAALAREPDRLKGKRLVIYQFAARELAFGDWKIFRD